MRPSLLSNHLIYICVAGLMSAMLFGAALMLPPGGIFASVLPLFLVGLSLGSSAAALCCAVSCAALMIVAGSVDSVSFALFTGIPGYYFIRQTLWCRGSEITRHWYPVLRVMAELTMMSAGFLMVLALMSDKSGGLENLVRHSLDNFQVGDPELALMFQQFLKDWNFTIFAMLAWTWVLMFYLFAFIANAILHRKHVELRPSLALEHRGLPVWLLILLVICGLLALVGKGADRYTAEALFMVLLLPYLLSGIAWVHRYSVQRQLHFRRLWISCFYIAIIVGQWPMLPVIALGLYLQLAEILDRHKKMG